MILAGIPMTLLAAVTTLPAKPDVVKNDQYYMSGAICDDNVCAPKRFRPSLHFSSLKSDNVLLGLPSLKQSWHVTLICDVHRGHLRKCRQSDGSIIGVETALKMVGELRVDPADFSKSSRAIIYVDDDAAGCPPWRCTPTPPPPPPPPPPRKS